MFESHSFRLWFSAVSSLGVSAIEVLCTFVRIAIEACCVSANQLDGMIAKIINETACPCSAYSCEHHREGYKIGIALIRKMVPKSDAKSQDDDLDEGQVISVIFVTIAMNGAAG